MSAMIAFNHFNFNVLDLDRSLSFYREALNLTVDREKEAGADLAAGPHPALRLGG